MAITAKRMYGTDNPGTGAGTLFTVTTSHQYVVREIIASNVTDAPATFTVSVGTDATDTRIFSAQVVPGRTTLRFPCFIVLESTEIMQGFQGTASAINLTIDGLDKV